jgi:hypothetical protein
VAAGRFFGGAADGRAEDEQGGEKFHGFGRGVRFE